jgi:rhamnogalacturonan endolyase
VNGQLKITDGSSARGACIILADPDSPWQQHQSPYLFWSYAGNDGTFTIPKVRPGTYTLYSFVPGVPGEFRRDNIEVRANKQTDLSVLEWTPERHGTLLWQIGTPDRSALEFKNGPTFRQWENFLRYRHDFPNEVNFVIGKSKESTDWHYMQPTQVKGESKPVEWTVQFDLVKPPKGEAFLTIATCSTRDVTMEVLVNHVKVGVMRYPYADSRDAIDSIGIRAGMYGRYIENVFRFPAANLISGQNNLTLRPVGRVGWLSYITYDFLRLEVSP